MRRSFSWFLPFLLVLIVYLLSSPSAPGIHSFFPDTSSHPLQALILTAHPDDECMFFGPTILSLVSQGVDVHALCLSTGDPGRVRELRKSYEVLGVGVEKVSVGTTLQDGMKNHWEAEEVASYLEEWFEIREEVHPDLVRILASHFAHPETISSETYR